MARLNINEIARMAGVSRATVSRYLNDGYVSEAKRKAIRKVVEETGYVPSAQAQTLRTGRTRFIGVIIPKISSESVGRMVAGISAVLNECGYNVLLAGTDNDVEQEIGFLRSLSERHVDGIILIGTIFTEGHRRAIADLKIPLVVLGQSVDGVSCVRMDDGGSMRALVDHVLESSSNPAYIGVTEDDLAAGRERTEAFCDVARAHGFGDAQQRVQVSDFTMEGGREAAQRVLDERPDVDAIICATDSIAAGAMGVLRERGLRIPEDVQVSGMGDSTLSRVLHPQLTTAHLFYRTSGSVAAELLVHLLDEGDAEVVERRMDYELVLRDSTR